MLYICDYSERFAGWVVSFPENDVLGATWTVDYVPEANTNLAAKEEDVVRAWE
jgi:hypothetical protein